MLFAFCLPLVALFMSFERQIGFYKNHHFWSMIVAEVFMWLELLLSFRYLLAGLAMH